MWKYVYKRVLQLIPAFIIVSFVVFWLMSIAGDPANVLGGIDATEEQLEAIRESLGLNRPILVRYADYMFNLVQGDLGNDIYGNPVWPQFASRIPYTGALVVISTILANAIAIPAGMAAAVRRGTWGDTLITFSCLFLDCLPIFWLGMMMQSIFAVKLGWLPTSGIKQGLLISIVLPTLTSVLSGTASPSRQSRSAMLECLGADYMRTAMAKGVRRKEAVRKHALPNALLPIITNVGSGLALSVGGAVTLETIFAWPGVGTLIIPAIRGANFPVACGCIIMSTFMIGFINLLTDVAYAFADPRVKARYTGK